MANTNKNEHIAPEGAVWVCAACGKRTRDRLRGTISHGWDESCFLHAVLCKESSLQFKDDKSDGLVVKADVFKEDS